MKRFVFISIIVSLFSTTYSGAQNNVELLRQGMKVLKTSLTSNNNKKKELEEKKQELSEKYVGKKVYLLKDSGSSGIFLTRAPREYAMSGDIRLIGNPGHQLYSLSDTIVIRKELKYYICTEVYQVRESDNPDALALKLSDGRKDNPVLVYYNGYCGPLRYEGHGYDGGEVSVSVKCDLGDLRTTMPESFVTDGELDSIAVVLQKQFSEKLALKRQQEAEVVREKARAEAERIKAEAERIKAENDAEREKEEARSLAIKNTKQQIAYLSDHYKLKAQNCQQYSGNMSAPKWLDGLFRSSPHVISGSYYYYENDDEERVPHGDFFVAFITGEVNNVSRYEIRGKFKHGYRDGLWTIKAKNHKGEYLKGYIYQFQYTDGLLNGDFVFIIPRSYSHEEIKGTFADGRITGSVSIKKLGDFLDSYRLFEGDVNEQGLPHGVWKESHIFPDNTGVPTKSERLYYNGCLVYRREKDESSGVITYSDQLSEEIRKPADFDKIQRISAYTTEISGVKYSIVDGDSDLYIDDKVFCSIFPDMKEWKVKLVKRKQTE